MNQTDCKVQVSVRIFHLFFLALRISVSVCKLLKLACTLFGVIWQFKRFRVDFSIASFSNHCFQYLNTFLFINFFHSTFDRPFDRMLIISGRSCFLRMLLVVITQLYNVASFTAPCLMMTSCFGPGLVKRVSLCWSKVAFSGSILEWMCRLGMAVPWGRSNQIG